MNDLERELQHLFEQRARDVDPAALAPDSIIRRGRRRQARTVFGGAVAGVVAIAVAIASVGSIQRPDDSTPAGRELLPPRSAIIGGVPVTAPAGWTLIDDWPLAALLPASVETCSSSGSATAVDASGSPIEVPPQPEASPSCTSEPSSLPAGVPVLQLANFEMPLTETVCGLGDTGPAADVPADGVAVYVAAFTDGFAIDRVAQACPALSTTEGTNTTTFSDTGSRMLYGAILVTGSAPSAEDVATARDYLESLTDTRIAPWPTAPPSTEGPGYVLAAGFQGEERWRLEAGITSLDNDGTPSLGATLVTTLRGEERARTLPPATPSEQVNGDYADVGYGDVGPLVVQFGTATTSVTGIDLVAADGSTTGVAMLPWPQGLRSLPSAVSAPSGRLWYATATALGALRPTLAPADSPTAQATNAAEPLQTRETASGELVIYGRDLGHDWEIRHVNGEIRFSVDGTNASNGTFSFVTGASTAVDVDGGTFLIGVFDPSVTSWSVATDRSDTTPARTIDGRSAPAQDASGAPANLWLLALPGAGTGMATGAGSLPTFVSWPWALSPDGLFGSGSDGVVSWGIVHHTDRCAQVKVIGADPSDSGTGDCLPSWYELSRNGGLPVIGGFYGREHATVVVVLPGKTPMVAQGSTPDCFTVSMESNFANTEFCVFSLAAGETTQVTFGENGASLGGPIAIHARPGALDLVDASPTASP